MDQPSAMQADAGSFLHTVSTRLSASHTETCQPSGTTAMSSTADCRMASRSRRTGPRNASQRPSMLKQWNVKVELRCVSGSIFHRSGDAPRRRLLTTTAPGGSPPRNTPQSFSTHKVASRVRFEPGPTRMARPYEGLGRISSHNRSSAPDLLLQLQHAVNQGLGCRRTARHINVDRDHAIATSDNVHARQRTVLGED